MLKKKLKTLISLLFIGLFCVGNLNSIPIQAQETPNITNINTVFSQEGTAECYISNFGIRQMKDGTESFDENDNIGNDSSDSNKRVRSFDEKHRAHTPSIAT